MALMYPLRRTGLILALFLGLSGAAFAQGTALGFSGLKQDPGAPVEVTSETLSIDRDAGRAILEGDVLVIQGDMRLTAPRVEVIYGTEGQQIKEIHAQGGVTIVTAADAAEAREARYDVATGGLVMSGNVLLTQGPSTISGERMVADLRAGTGRMEGRVKTLFNTEPKAGN
ncbi:lipopolysaccharide transport periplasmic protein LptA [Falsigemmobacter faecalis]|uniref:Lipopolysaccharide transport periplasmic protein LptA n=2 Tax=Falsigemmobacter faecalis TaxID=2488730 RepID=A0A3P3DGV6_9RHOB|nr:lipopolysaccharide transport periplasmic protein LptA [Falsigemmobacter faecalis]